MIAPMTKDQPHKVKACLTLVLLVGFSAFVSAQTSRFQFDANGNLVTQSEEFAAQAQITGQPQNRLVDSGGTAAFSVVAQGSRPLTYQWRFNGAPLAGATADTLLVTNVSAAVEGLYSVVIANPSGSVTSAPAFLLLDTDHDGLGDAWELTHFGDLEQNASGDADGDRSTNLREFQNGTNPTDANSYAFRLLVISDAGTVLKSPDQPAYTNGQSVTLTAVPHPNGAFHAWLGDVVTRTNPLTLVMTSDQTVYARFTPILFTWASAASGDWDSAENWSPPLVPGSLDSAVINRDVTVTLNTSADCTDVNLGNTASNPTLTGTGTLRVHGNFTWASGVMSGNGRTVIAPEATLNLVNAVPVVLDERTLENAGAASWTSEGAFLFSAGAVLTNRSGAVFLLQSGAQFGAPGGVNRVDNVGNFRKTVVANTVTVPAGLSFNNGGEVQIEAGTLRLAGGGAHNGAFHLSSGATLDLAGNHDIRSSAQITGPGNLTLSGGTANLAGLINVSGTNTFDDTFLGGTVDVAGNFISTNNTLIVAGNVTANFNGTGSVSPAVLTVTGNGIVAGSNTVTALAAMNWVGGSMSGNGRTVIAPGATLVANNAGNVSLVGRALEIAGTVEWTGAGAIGLISGAVITNRPGSLFTIRNAAPFSFIGAGNRIDNAGILRKAAALGVGTTTSIGNGILFNNYGAVEIQRGIVAANGGFTFSPGARLHCTLGGTLPGSGYGQLQIAGAASVAGALSVDFAPNFSAGADDAFSVLTAGSRSGAFAPFLYPSNAYTLQLTHTPTAVVVRSVGPAFATANPLPEALRFAAYTLQVVGVSGATPIAFELASGSLPSGLTLSSAGLIAGVPTVRGLSQFTIRIRDTAGAVNQQTFSLRVVEPVLAPPGLISWWRAEGNALDSANSNHGTTSNGVTYLPGKVGQAFRFDGLDDFVWIPDATNLRPASITLETWARFNGAQGAVLGRAWGSAVHNSYGIWQLGGNVNGTIGDTNQSAAVLSAPFAPDAGRWYHVAFTFDDATKHQTLYLDGRIVASAPSFRTIGYDSHPLVLGGDIDNGVAAFLLNGAVDEAAIYNRALSAGEIAAIHEAGIAGKELTMPYAQWKEVYLGNRNASDTDDPDGDGLGNLAEFIADTSPTNALSNLQITHVSFGTGQLVLEWQGGTWATQFLQRRLALQPADTWRDVFTNPPPTANPIRLDLPLETNAAFYRLRVTR